MDAAHDWTDDQIEALAKRFEGVYGEAARSMRESLDAHLASFERENAEWAKLVESGAETQANYDAWRRAQATRTDYLHGMVDRLATDATRANQKALDMVNDRIPRVYAENANFGAYQVESGLGWDTHSFDLYDESTVRRLMATTEHDQIIHEVIPVGPARPDLQSLRVDLDAAKDVQWNRQKFTAAVTQSILQGESIPNAAKRLMGVLNMDKGMATRAARTAMTSAENAGRVDSYKRAKAMGIELEQEWMATLDGRTRYSHRQLDGQHVPVGEKFEVEGHEIEFPGDPKAHPSETYNCRCTLVAWLPGIEKEDPERWSRLPKGMSYDEWKSGKLAQGAAETALKHVDMSSPLWSQLGSIDASEVAARVDELLEGAHGRAAELWEKFEGQLTMNNPEWDGGAYFTHRGNRGVSMNVRNSLDDVGDRGTLATWFHEFGHHIDNLSNDAYKFSYTSVDYGNRMFHDTLKREVAANIKEVQASMTARLNELKRDRDIMGMYNEGLLPWHSRYSATMYQQAREHIDDADWLRAHHLPSVAHKSTVEEREERLYKKFSEDAQVPKRVVPIKNARQRAGKEITEAGHDTQLALGDIYEGATKGECQDTYGHTNGYWEYDDKLPKEAFAEFYSAECIYSVRPEVLNVMMKRLPDSYEAYKRIVGVILDA